MFWGIDVWTSFVTALHILLFSVLRFVSIRWPPRFTIFTLKRTKVIYDLIFAYKSLKSVVFKLCVSSPPLRIVVNIRASPKNSPAGSSLRIVQQEGFRSTFAPPLRTVRASQFEKR